MNLHEEIIKTNIFANWRDLTRRILFGEGISQNNTAAEVDEAAAALQAEVVTETVELKQEYNIE